MPAVPNSEWTSGDLYRALQERKTDDLAAVREVIARRQAAGPPAGSTFHVVDLCAGIGRLACCYPPNWLMTGVDRDGVALALLRARRPDVRTVQTDLRRHLSLALAADIVVCAHNSANEVRHLPRLLATASAAMAPDALFFLDLLVGDEPYAQAYLRTALPPLVDRDGGSWLVHSEVFQHGRGRHTLLLLATALSPTGDVCRRLLCQLQRESYSEDIILRVATQHGLVLLGRPAHSRFVFGRSTTVT